MPCVSELRSSPGAAWERQIARVVFNAHSLPCRAARSTARALTHLLLSAQATPPADSSTVPASPQAYAEAASPPSATSTATHTLPCLTAALPQSAPPTTLLQPLGDMMGDGLPDDSLMEDSLMGLRETEMLDMLLG